MRALRLAVLMSLAVGAAAQPGVPELTGRIVDNADLILPTQEVLLADRLQAFEDSTGRQIAVLTIRSLNGEVLEPYATEVFRTWGLGDAERNDGVLLLVAKNDRKIRIEVGYGLEGDIPDALAARIIRDEMTPRFRDGDFGGGIESATDALMGAITGTYSPPSAISRYLSSISPGLLALGLVVLVPPWLWFMQFGSPTFSNRFGVAFFGWVMSLFLALAVGVIAETPLIFLLTIPVALGYVVVDTIIEALPGIGPRRAIRRRAFKISNIRSSRIAAEKAVLFKAARTRGDKTVVYEGRTINVPPVQTSSSGGGSSWSSSGGSSFSGGGGSSGGGGASGGW